MHERAGHEDHARLILQARPPAALMRAGGMLPNRQRHVRKKAAGANAPDAFSAWILLFFQGSRLAVSRVNSSRGKQCSPIRMWRVVAAGRVAVWPLWRQVLRWHW